MKTITNCAVCGAAVDLKKETRRPFICGTSISLIPQPRADLIKVNRIHRCFACGYCTDTPVWRKPGLKKLSTIKNLVFSPEYQQHLTNPSLETYTNEDLCAALVFVELGEYLKAGSLILKAVGVIEYRISIGRDMRPYGSIISELKRQAKELLNNGSGT